MNTFLKVIICLFCSNLTKIMTKKIIKVLRKIRFIKFIRKILSECTIWNWPLYFPFPTFKKRSFLKEKTRRKKISNSFQSAQDKLQMADRLNSFNDIPTFSFYFDFDLNNFVKFQPYGFCSDRFKN